MKGNSTVVREDPPEASPRSQARAPTGPNPPSPYGPTPGPRTPYGPKDRGGPPGPGGVLRAAPAVGPRALRPCPLPDRLLRSLRQRVGPKGAGPRGSSGQGSGLGSPRGCRLPDPSAADYGVACLAEGSVRLDRAGHMAKERQLFIFI